MSARLTTGRFRPNVLTATVLVAVIAAAWFAGAWSTTGMRDADFERLGELGHARVLAPLIAAWSAFAADAWRLALSVAAAQVVCCAGVVVAAWRASRSTWIALVAGSLTVASPFPERWLDRPAGLADALAATALLAAFAAVTDVRMGRRARTIVACAAGFAAVLVSGWACVPLVVLAVLAGGPLAPALFAGTAAALAARFALGIPVDAVLGHGDWFGRHALGALRLLVAAAFAAPAVVFVLTRPRLALSAWLTRDERAIVAASVALVPVSGFLVADWAAVFCAQLGLTLAAASILGRTRLPIEASSAAIAMFAILTAGVFARPAPPADDLALRQRERALVRSAAPALTIVDHGDPAIRARYSPAHLAYLAGRPVDVRYAERPPAAATEPVFEVGPRGLLPLDGVIRAAGELQRLRRHLQYDIGAASDRGILSSRAAQSTPSGLGVIPKLAEPAPGGPLDAIVVISGFSDTFEHVRVQPGDRLVYLVAKALDTGSAARGTVTVEIPGRPPVVVSDDVPPAEGSASLGWRLRAVSLPVRTATAVRIRFAASSPSGRNFGDWVAYGAPAIVGP